MLVRLSLQVANLGRSFQSLLYKREMTTAHQLTREQIKRTGAQHLTYNTIEYGSQRMTLSSLQGSVFIYYDLNRSQEKLKAIVK